MEGYLDKYGSVIHGYRTRYFVLRNGYLSYSKTKDDVSEVCRGSIYVKRSVINLHSNNRKKKSHSLYSFSISVGKKRSWTLRARNKTDYDQWIQCLREAQRADFNFRLSSMPPELESPRSDISHYSYLSQSSCSDAERSSPTTSEEEPDVSLSKIRTSFSQLRQCFFEFQQNSQDFHASFSQLKAMYKNNRHHSASHHGSLEEMSKIVASTNNSYTQLINNDISFLAESAVVESHLDLMSQMLTETSTKKAELLKILSMLPCEVDIPSTVADFDETTNTNLAVSTSSSVDSNSSSISNSCLFKNIYTPRVIDDFIELRNLFKQRGTTIGSSQKCEQKWKEYISTFSNSDATPKFRVSPPDECREPMTLLQKMVEPLQFAHLLDRVANSNDDVADQLAQLSAFVVSSAFVNGYRLALPIEPSNGETFQFCWDNGKGIKFWVVCEHAEVEGAPVSCMHVESLTNNWTLTSQSVVQYYTHQSKFAIVHNSVTKLHLPSGKQFTWNMPDIVIRSNSPNLSSSSMSRACLWLDQTGIVTIKSNMNNFHAVLNFHPYSYFSKHKQPPRYVAAVVYDNAARAVMVLQGQWDKFVEVLDNCDQQTNTSFNDRLWDIDSVDDISFVNRDLFNFSNFTLALSVFESCGLKTSSLLPTDSRRRFQHEDETEEIDEGLLFMSPKNPHIKQSRFNFGANSTSNHKWFVKDESENFVITIHNKKVKLPLFKLGNSFLNNFSVSNRRFYSISM